MSQSFISVTFPPTVKGNIILQCYLATKFPSPGSYWFYIHIYQINQACLFQRCLCRMLQKSYCLFAFMEGAYFYFVHFCTKNDLRNKTYLSKSESWCLTEKCGTVLGKGPWPARYFFFRSQTNGRREDWLLTQYVIFPLWQFTLAPHT